MRRGILPLDNRCLWGGKWIRERQSWWSRWREHEPPLAHKRRWEGCRREDNGRRHAGERRGQPRGCVADIGLCTRAACAWPFCMHVPAACESSPESVSVLYSRLVYKWPNPCGCGHTVHFSEHVCSRCVYIYIFIPSGSRWSSQSWWRWEGARVHRQLPSMKPMSADSGSPLRPCSYLALTCILEEPIRSGQLSVHWFTPGMRSHRCMHFDWTFEIRSHMQINIRQTLHMTMTVL